MIKILNQDLKTVAILENAYSIGYEKAFNELWKASFSLPLNDPKNDECQSLYFVEVTDQDEYIGLFRIIPSNTVKNESTNEVKYQCEHVLSTLLDDVLFLYHQNDNLTTRNNIQYVIDQQSTQRWKLGSVDIARYFSYKWENENLLSALFSIPKPFDVQYQWTWDTQSYPWTLNLIVPESEVSCEIRYGKNQVGIEKEVDPTVIFNRIYPLGYGEGDNQLNIKSVNGGVPYVEDAESIAEYGVRAYIWSDKKYEDATSLKANAQALLLQWKVPKVSYKASAADISSITGEDADKLKMGRIVRMIDPDLGTLEVRIMKESKSDVTGNPGDINLEIANKTDDLSTTQADMERRQQINELYAQGATNMDSHDFEDNADTANPAVMKFYLPEEMVRVNRLDLTFECTNFRAYSKAAKSTDTSTKTTTSGGNSTQTSSSGGGTTVSASSGGGTTASSSSGGGTTATSTHKTFQTVLVASGVPENSVGTENWGYHVHHVNIDGNYFSHDHNVTVPNHTHSVTVPNHSHSVTVPNHSHDVTIPAHSHDVEIPGHGHDLIYGIYQHGTLPSNVTIKVDGNTVTHTGIEGENIDLIPYLSKEPSGNVTRGWHRVEITPNDLARISAQVTSQFFIQSRGQYSL